MEGFVVETCGCARGHEELVLMRDHKGEGEMPLLAKDDTLVLELYPLGSKGTLLDVEPDLSLLTIVV